MDKQGEEQLFAKSETGQSDMSQFYDPIDASSPEYTGANSGSPGGEVDELRAQQEAEWKAELAKLESDINTLRTVLSAKVYQASELKKKLGYTPMNEFKQDLRQGLSNIRESDAYQKTNSAFKSFGAFASKKFGDMRNSNTFKSFEEKVGGAYTNVKTRMSGSKSENSFVDAMDRDASDPIALDAGSQSPVLSPDASDQGPR